jgi:hypothetical protein
MITEMLDIRNLFIGFEVLTAVTMKSSVFWDITSCSPVLDPENGGDMFLRNVDWLSLDCTDLYPRRQLLQEFI